MKKKECKFFYSSVDWVVVSFENVLTSYVKSKDAFHLWELTGQPIPIVMRISLFFHFLYLTIQISQVLNIMHKGDGFSAKSHRKSLFHCQNVLSDHGLAGQFRLLESALSIFPSFCEIQEKDIASFY